MTASSRLLEQGGPWPHLHERSQEPGFNLHLVVPLVQRLDESEHVLDLLFSTAAGVVSRPQRSTQSQARRRIDLAPLAGLDNEAKDLVDVLQRGVVVARSPIGVIDRPQLCSSFRLVLTFERHAQRSAISSACIALGEKEQCVELRRCVQPSAHHLAPVQDELWEIITPLAGVHPVISVKTEITGHKNGGQ
jgi:hypothetical protein